MALLRRDLASPLCPEAVKDASTNATAEVFRNASGTIRFITCVTSTAVGFFQAYDGASPTVGTTAPDFLWKFPASTTTTIMFPESVAAFSSAIAAATTTTGGTSGTSNPAATVAVTIGIEV